MRFSTAIAVATTSVLARVVVPIACAVAALVYVVAPAVLDVIASWSPAR